MITAIALGVGTLFLIAGAGVFGYALAVSRMNREQWLRKRLEREYQKGQLSVRPPATIEPPHSHVGEGWR